MTIRMDHLIVPARDPVASARLLAELLDAPWEAEQGIFTPVYVSDTLTLDFARSDRFEPHHYCFHVSEPEFDAIFGCVKAAGLKYRSQPIGPDDSQINTRYGGRNIYWRDATGHIWEMLTVSYARRESPPLS